MALDSGSTYHALSDRRLVTFAAVWMLAPDEERLKMPSVVLAGLPSVVLALASESMLMRLYSLACESSPRFIGQLDASE
jgi:hypothetical protein